MHRVSFTPFPHVPFFSSSYMSHTALSGTTTKGPLWPKPSHKKKRNIYYWCQLCGGGDERPVGHFNRGDVPPSQNQWRTKPAGPHCCRSKDKARSVKERGPLWPSRPPPSGAEARARRSGPPLSCRGQTPPHAFSPATCSRQVSVPRSFVLRRDRGHKTRGLELNTRSLLCLYSFIQR